MKLILGDITKITADAVVIPARTDLKPAPGISEAVFQAADRQLLLSVCRRLGHCRIGHAVVTPSCGLPCKYIIHVAGPDWYSGHKSDRLFFADGYIHALQKARVYHCRSVALPLMFSGEYHIPRAQALTIVSQVIHSFEQAHPDMDLTLVVYTKSIYDLARTILQD